MTKDLQQIREALCGRTVDMGNRYEVHPDDFESAVALLDNLIAKEQAMGDARKGAESALPESTSSSAATPSPARLVEKLRAHMGKRLGHWKKEVDLNELAQEIISIVQAHEGDC